jgi:pyruvate formate lyase activating enzyme
MKKEAYLYERLDNNAVHCFLCRHNCVIASSQTGFCKVRKNIKGVLYSNVYGELVALNIDPIEKKPLYHFYPGSLSYSIATIGCNFRCGFCQNWQISQEGFKAAKNLKPSDIISAAKDSGSVSISYTYTEPTIFFEFAYDTAKAAKKEGLSNIFVSNGYMSLKAIDMIAPYLDAANIDLKSFSEDFYIRNCKGHLGPVLDSIRYMLKKGIWVEITTLIIPGENSSKEELAKIADFIASIDPNIPWHISRFYPDYRFSDREPTPVKLLLEAKEIAQRAGLRYVYLGNIQEDNDSYCYNCKKPVIERGGPGLLKNRISRGLCPYCSAPIAGIF